MKINKIPKFAGLYHISTSITYPQSNGKIEHHQGTIYGKSKKIYGMNIKRTISAISKTG